MDLNLDEQRLVAVFRKLTPTAKEELMGLATSLVRRVSTEPQGSNQCGIKQQEEKPESEKMPFFTE